jgi:signal transduction histidine kinase/CheY-like chemotaxis protein
MRFLDIRARMLLTATAPVIFLATVLAVIFLGGRVGDVGEAHQQRNRALARQLATAAEYGLFSGNTQQLQLLMAGATRAPSVQLAAVLDAQGRPLAVAGGPLQEAPVVAGYEESRTFDAIRGLDVLWQPIRAQQIALEELSPVSGSKAAALVPPLGYVLLEVSRDSLRQRENEMLLTGIAVTLGGLVLGLIMALGLGRGVLRPVQRISAMVQRLQQGDFSVRGALRQGDPLRDLQRGLNVLADRLAWREDELQSRIEEATRGLRASKEQAEAATLAKTRFLAAASHDLRQPTHALGLFIARLGQLPQDPQSRQLIDKLDASVRAMQDLLDALLDLSRLEAEAVELDPKPIDVAELFAQLDSTFSPVASGKGLRLRVRPSRVWISSDLPLLQRILLNLLGNSLRYTRHGGVLLACRPATEAGKVWIEVWDTGIGIAPEHQEVVFQEFFQVANPQRDRSHGLGLGLNIVRRASALLGHRLELRSVPGRGTRFRIQVPLCSPGVAKPEAPVPVVVNPLPWRVLLVEDDPLSRDAMRGLLESWGMVVTPSGSLDAALLQISRAGPPDLIVSDYRLPEGVNGIEAIARLRAQAGRSLPACLVSGDIDPQVLQSVRQAGLTLLNKPVRPAKLRSLIRRLMQERAATGMGDAPGPDQAAGSEPE